MANGDETKIKVSPVEVLTVRKVGSGYVYLGIHDEDGREYAHAMPNVEQWDAFVAAGDRALGRVSDNRCADIAMAYHRAYVRGKISYTSKVMGRRESFKIAVHRAALAMVREAGPTVPRGAVEALRAELAAMGAEGDAPLTYAAERLAAMLGAPAEPR